MKASQVPRVRLALGSAALMRLPRGSAQLCVLDLARRLACGVVAPCTGARRARGRTATNARVVSCERGSEDHSSTVVCQRQLAPAACYLQLPEAGSNAAAMAATGRGRRPNAWILSIDAAFVAEMTSSPAGVVGKYHFVVSMLSGTPTVISVFGSTGFGSFCMTKQACTHEYYNRSRSIDILFYRYNR